MARLQCFTRKCDGVEISFCIACTASLNISNHFLQIVSDTRLFGQRAFGHSSFVSLITKSLT